MSSIPLPALAIKPPEQQDPLASFQKLMALKSLGQSQQLQQQQMQTNQQEQQIRQQQLSDQQATTQAMKEVNPKDPKYTANPQQYYSDVRDAVLGHGGSANAATAVEQHGIQVQTSLSTLNKDQLDTFLGKHKAVGDALKGIESVPDEQLHATAAAKVGELAQSGILDPQTAQQVMGAIQSTPDPKDLRSKIDVFANTSAGATNVAALAKTNAEAQEAGAKTEEATATAQQKRLESQYYQAHGGAPGVPAEVLQQNAWLEAHPGKTAADYVGAKAAITSQAELPAKVEAARAEGQARQLVEGMEKPVYALDPKTGQKSLMSATDALQAGIHTMLPVSAKEVGDDTMLINRLGDVRQKVAQYEQNISNLGSTVSAKDQGNIAALIGSGRLAVGAFGTELPMDRVNAILQKENISGLSDDGKKLLVSYYNAREAMQGYTRVLTGSGRSNEKAMQLNLDALPSPATSDAGYAKESLRQFKQNLQIVGQGLPNIPGIKSPEEFEQQIGAPSAAAPAAAKLPQLGQTVMIKGRPKRVTAVHPDGSFDAQ